MTASDTSTAGAPIGGPIGGPVAAVGAETAWGELVASALLGTDRRPVPDTALLPAPVREGLTAIAAGEPTGAEGGDAASRLLDVAALLTVYRRAGRPLGSAAPGVVGSAVAGAAPVPVDAAPSSSRPFPPAAANLRGQALIAAAGERGEDAERACRLLTEWLTVVGERGYDVGPALLPRLLDLAVRRRELARPVAAVLGERGRWLARLRPAWAAIPHATTQTEAVDVRDRDVWDHGEPDRRRTWLKELRRQDPAAARDLLGGRGWTSEKREDRSAFVGALEIGLSADDEPLLERLRRDRARDVRRTVELLLALLPGSSFTARLEALALPCLRVERRGLRTVLAVDLPDPDAGVVDAELQCGDAPGFGPPTEQPRPALLYAAMSLVAPRRWEEHLGRSAADLFALPVADGLGRVVHGGWQVAACLHDDVDWLRAAMSAGNAEDVGRLVRSLPARVRDELLPDALREGGSTLDAWVDAYPPPWPEELAGAVLAALTRRAGTGGRRHSPSLFAAAAAGLPPTPAVLSALENAAAAHPEGQLRTGLTRLIDDLTTRHLIHEELR